MEPNNSKQALIPLKDGNAITFKDKIIQSNTLPKIRESNVNSEIVQALAKIFQLIGLQKPPAPDVTATLITFIRDKYKHLTPEDLILAFEGAITKQFKAPTDHYQNFNALYLSGILSPYLKHRGKLIVDQHYLTQTAIGKEPTEEEKQVIHEEFIRSSILEPYKILLKTGVHSFHMEKMLFETLEEKGLIELSTKEKIKIFEETKEEFLQELNKPKENVSENKIAKRMKERIESEGIGAYTVTIQGRAKERAFKQWITEAANKKVNLETLLK